MELSGYGSRGECGIVGVLDDGGLREEKAGLGGYLGGHGPAEPVSDQAVDQASQRLADGLLA